MIESVLTNGARIEVLYTWVEAHARGIITGIAAKNAESIGSHWKWGQLIFLCVQANSHTVRTVAKH